MAKIFICGGSAVGKTTLVERINKELGIPKDEEVIREFPLNWFKKHSLMHREVLFLLSQMDKEAKIEKDYAIYDRSLLDVIAWMTDKGQHDDILYKYIGENFISADDYYFIAPPETKWFIEKHWDDYTKDKLRWHVLTELTGTTEREEFIKRYVEFMEFEREVMERILSFSQAKVWRLDRDWERDWLLQNYNWADVAFKLVKKIVGFKGGKQ